MYKLKTLSEGGEESFSLSRNYSENKTEEGETNKFQLGINISGLCCEMSVVGKVILPKRINKSSLVYTLSDTGKKTGGDLLPEST